MAGYLTLGKASASTLDKETSSVELHTDMLKAIFGSLALPETALAELDGLLTSAGDKLKISVDKIHKDLKHVLFLYFFESPQGLEEIKVAKLRLFYISIDEKSFNVSIGKHKAARFRFKMTMVDTDCMMESEVVQKDRDKLVTLVEELTKMNIDEVYQAISPKVISKEGE